MTKEYPYYLNKLVVKESPLHGKGLFTTVDIASEEIICVIEGDVIDENECIRREEEESNVYIFWNGENYIDAANNKLIRHINHVCDPNSYVEDRNEHSLFLIAENDIKAGEELSIDYGYDEIYENCECHICKNEN